LINDLKFWKKIIDEGKFDDLEYAQKWLPEVQVRLQTLKQFVQFTKYLFEYVPVSDEILYNKKMKVTEEVVKKHLPKIIELLENTQDWSDENLKNLIVSYNKEN
jgi:hypothetical protein